MTGENDASSQTFSAVLDRFEEDQAVLLLESDGETVDEIVIQRDDLPVSGRHQDAIFTVTVDGDTVVEIEYESAETEERADASQEQFDRLARRLPEDNTE